MKHQNYHEFSANNSYELGFKMGSEFKTQVQSAITKERQDNNFPQALRTAEKMLNETKEIFPEYIEELKGYADGAEVDFLELWTMAIEEDAYIEVEKEKLAKCTTLITQDGKVMAHSEDWSPQAVNNISVVKKTLRDLTTFELYYTCTLGGTSIGVNSFGFGTSVNTLFSTPSQIGIPSCISARMMLDTMDPESDFQKIKSLKLASGYNHNIIDPSGKIMNLEFTISDNSQTFPESPFVHSNHCLIAKGSFLSEDQSGTISRLDFGKDKVSNETSIEDLEKILEDNSKGPDKSINNERTVARMIIDFENMNCYVWLLREKELGWVKYPIDFIKK